jgi:hypothetical protein
MRDLLLSACILIAVSLKTVIPAKAGIQLFSKFWMPDQVRHDEKGHLTQALFSAAAFRKSALLPHDQIIQHIKPREEPVHDRPEDRMVQAPGDRYCQRRTKADA